MNGDPCRRPGCAGAIEEGYCNLCGHAEIKSATAMAPSGGTGTEGKLPHASSRSGRFTGAITTGTGSSPVSRTAQGSRRTSRSTSRATRRQLGAGLITLPDLPSVDPEKAVLPDAHVPERKRFCAKCEAPLKREVGFCGKCGTRYSFIPTLKAGDVVVGQYEVKGPIAFGGLGWVYLAFDTFLSRYVVLKGLLNAQDQSAAAAAVAERQFLAAVKHPNIVGIYNFVQLGTEGFIVMEYVGGQTLKGIRQARGPLPVAEAVAYIHRILPAFGYLHRLGLVYCDFKPDNVMLEKDDVKLIDLGGVRRQDDPAGDIYGTVGYSAPEAGEGPTPSSDLFTIGRTLAVLLTDIRDFSKEHRYTLPSPAEEPRFREQESLYRFLLKSTAEKADDRFETADEMADQLLGILREVVAVETGSPRPGTSLYFGADPLALDAGDEMAAVDPDPKHLPLPALDVEDPGAQAVSSAIALADPAQRAAALRLVCKQVPLSREARLRLAGTLTEIGEYPEAEGQLATLGKEDPWDWRVLWFQARLRFAQSDASGARRLFDQVYFDLPGEVVPKLALGLAAEMAGDLPVAIGMYTAVTRTDPNFVSAVFGLARCYGQTGDRHAAVAALRCIPPSSALYPRARVVAIRLLLGHEAGPLSLADVTSASALAEGLPLPAAHRSMLTREILGAAVAQLRSRNSARDPVGGTARDSVGDGTMRILGHPLEEGSLRAGLESSLREMARSSTGEERIRLVDEANQMRPRTLI